MPQVNGVSTVVGLLVLQYQYHCLSTVVADVCISKFASVLLRLYYRKGDEAFYL